jgi:hypothetical protein
VRLDPAHVKHEEKPLTLRTEPSIRPDKSTAVLLAVVGRTLLVLLCDLQVVTRLQVQPELRSGLEECSETQRSVGGHSAFLFQYCRNTVCRHVLMFIAS